MGNRDLRSKRAEAFAKKNETAARPREFSRSDRSSDTTHTCPPGADYPYHQVTDADIWSDDPRSPNYNRHIVIDPKNPPDNYTHEKMRSGDFAYHWLVEIRHNSDPPVPGAGSAIFFHIRRGVNRPTTGCTTMAQDNLVKVITWLRAKRHPCYALLPAGEYENKWRAWNLPSPDALRGAVSLAR